MHSNILVLATLVLVSPSLAWYKSESETPCKTHKTHTTEATGPETVVTPPSYTPSGTSPPYPTSSAEGAVSSSLPGTGGYSATTIIVPPTPSSYSSAAPAPTSEAEGGETSTTSVAVYPTSEAEGASTSVVGYSTTTAEGGATSSLVVPVGGYNTTSKAAGPTSTAGGTAPISGAGMSQVGVGSLLLGVFALGFAFL